MKLTQQSSTNNGELVCEITQAEFEKLSAEVAAIIITKSIGDEPDAEDFMFGITMTKMFATLVANLANKMFTDPTTNENKDKQEEN
jgi:hypothetical protein